LSLAAVAEDGVPVVGAEVMINDLSLGTTPFEGELDPSLDAISLKIRKEGFTTNEVELKRAGRAVIGPATVSLKRATTTASTTTPETPPTQVALAEQPTTPEPPTAEETPPPKAETPPAEEPKPDPPPPRADPKPDPPPPREPTPRAPRQVAEIQLGTSPYADTTIDGRKYGSTPFFGPRKLTLPVGNHRVEFFDKQNNKKYRYSIRIKAPDPNNKVVIQFNKNDPPKVEGQVELRKLD
jgi:hypothetical protein